MTQYIKLCCVHIQNKISFEWKHNYCIVYGLTYSCQHHQHLLCISLFPFIILYKYSANNIVNTIGKQKNAQTISTYCKIFYLIRNCIGIFKQSIYFKFQKVGIIFILILLHCSAKNQISLVQINSPISSLLLHFLLDEFVKKQLSDSDNPHKNFILLLTFEGRKNVCILAI